MMCCQKQGFLAFSYESKTINNGASLKFYMYVRDFFFFFFSFAYMCTDLTNDDL